MDLAPAMHKVHSCTQRTGYDPSNLGVRLDTSQVHYCIRHLSLRFYSLKELVPRTCLDKCAILLRARPEYVPLVDIDGGRC